MVKATMTVIFNFTKGNLCCSLRVRFIRLRVDKSHKITEAGEPDQGAALDRSQPASRLSLRMNFTYTDEDFPEIADDILPT